MASADQWLSPTVPHWPSLADAWRASLAVVSRSHGDASDDQAKSPSLEAVETFEVFIRRHERTILNYLWRVIGDEQSAYDLAQETFLRAWQHFDEIQQYDKPRAWLFRVATNLALTLRQRRAAPVGAATPLDEENGPSTSDHARRVVEGEIVRGALQELTPKRRAALVLREVYGLNTAEIASTLDMTADAVKMALSRAREQFRSIYLRETDGN